MKSLERVYPWLLLAPVVLPVVIWGGVIYPYLVPKTLAFYALALISFAAFALLAAHGYAFFFERLRAKETWIPAALLAVAYATSLAGVDFYRSFWSVFVRGDGLLMLTCAVGYFYLILLSADRAFFERLIRASAVVGGFVAVYGIGEWLTSGGRIGSLLGNAAFFAGYLGIAFYATLAAARTVSGSWRTAAYVLAGLEVLAIVLSATRGMLVALLAALLLALAYVAYAGGGKRRTQALALLIVIIVTGALGFALRGMLSQVPFAPVARLATISTSDADVASRLFIWKHMVGEIEKRPILGVGAEHVSNLFDSFYDPSQIQEEWFDRSHNAFLDYAAQFGIFGLALYLGLIALFFLAALRLKRRGETMLGALLALLAVTYAVGNFFVFDTISSFWLLLALLAAALALTGTSAKPRPLTLPAWARFASWPAALVLLALLLPVSAYPALAAYDLAQAYRYQLVDPAREAAYLAHGLALHTYGDLEYGYQVYGMYAGVQATGLSGDKRTIAYEAAEAILADNFAKYPYDARTGLYLAHTLSLAPPATAVDRDLLTSALTRTLRLSPKRSQPWYILMNLTLQDANKNPVGSAARAAGYAAAEDLVSRYLALVPNLSQPHFVLAQLKLAQGDAQGAAAEAAKGKADYKSDLETAKRAAGYYENVQDWEDARFFLADAVAAAPNDDALRYDFAKVTYLSGDPETAAALVDQIRAHNPSILASDPNFMAAISAYEQSH